MKRLYFAALAVCLLFYAGSASAQTPVQQVLLLQSFPRGSLPLDSFIANFRADLDERARQPVNMIPFVVSPTGLVGAPDQAVVDYIRATFADRPEPDLIMTVGGPAAQFARAHRQQIFPGTPILFAAVDSGYLRAAPLGQTETAVPVADDFPQLVDDILQVRPETRQVFVIVGSSALGTFWRRELDDQFARFGGRLTFLWSSDLSLHEILERCTRLPPDSAILYVTLIADSRGGAYADERALADLHATANAPIFAKHTVMLGHGTVGGHLLSIEDVSRRTADVAVRLLNGAPPASVRVPPTLSGPAIFDWRELERWSIPETRLPPGSDVRFRSPSLWHEYRGTIVSAAAALIVQSLLIAGLVYQRRARHRAELDSRRNLELAADASRRQTMTALTSSIAHELGQPLSSIVHNAQALQMMIAADRATPGAIDEILADIRNQGVQATEIIDRHRTMLRSRHFDTKPIDLHAVIDGSLALVGHAMRARRIEASLDLSPSPCIVAGDHVLLQQVVVNLLMNAMDAMVETLPSRRHIMIGTEVRRTDVELSVQDNGPGLPADIDARLFEPFVTSKSHGIGIGLTIARTIIDAHGGTLEAQNSPQGGAIFKVTLPRKTARIPAEAPAAE